ncbi:hypothetical protein T492DRAFT_1035696 [Pavlovales sp. CCMP2436]|nr:hypothetical protein T492DRAFT_1035696 [Pavlovales sp. CCMP2436]
MGPHSSAAAGAERRERATLAIAWAALSGAAVPQSARWWGREGEFTRQAQGRRGRNNVRQLLDRWRGAAERSWGVGLRACRAARMPATRAICRMRSDLAVARAASARLARGPFNRWARLSSSLRAIHHTLQPVDGWSAPARIAVQAGLGRWRANLASASRAASLVAARLAYTRWRRRTRHRAELASAANSAVRVMAARIASARFSSGATKPHVAYTRRARSALPSPPPRDQWPAGAQTACAHGLPVQVSLDEPVRGRGSAANGAAAESENKAALEWALAERTLAERTLALRSALSRLRLALRTPSAALKTERVQKQSLPLRSLAFASARLSFAFAFRRFARRRYDPRPSLWQRALRAAKQRDLRRALCSWRAHASRRDSSAFATPAGRRPGLLSPTADASPATGGLRASMASRTPAFPPRGAPPACAERSASAVRRRLLTQHDDSG